MTSSIHKLAASRFRPEWWCSAVTNTEGFTLNFPWKTAKILSIQTLFKRFPIFCVAVTSSVYKVFAEFNICNILGLLVTFNYIALFYFSYIF